MSKYNIFKLNKKIFWILVVVFVFLICIILSIIKSQKSVKEYQFPLQTEDIEYVLTEQNLAWHITDKSVLNDSRIMYTFKNEENITIGVDAWTKDNHKIMSMSWFLPSNLTTNQLKDFFSKEFPRHLELPGIFYGNKRGLDKALNEMLSYYLDESNYDNGIYWNKRVGNDHIKTQIRSDKIQNHIISLIIIPNEEYEYYLRASDNAWKEAASSENVKIIKSIVSELKVAEKEYITPDKDMDIILKHFSIHGSLEDIKENKKISESLININSNNLKPNKDKYLNAKLVDDTGSIDVFLQMTSLNKEELSLKRNYNVIMFYNNNEFVYVVRPGALNSEE